MPASGPDFERAWFALKARIATASSTGKRSWGASQIAELMAEIEVESLEWEDGADPVSSGRATAAGGQEPAIHAAA